MTKNIKKILLLSFCLICSLFSYSQNQLMWKAEQTRSSAYIESRQQWTNWTDWDRFFLSFLLDLDGAYLSVGNETFRVLEIEDNAEKNDDYIIFSFLTKYDDGKCRFSFYISKNGENDFLYHTYMEEKNADYGSI